MEIMSYKRQAELFLWNYVLADSRILYTSIIGGICACKVVYDFTQSISFFYVESYSSLSRLQKIDWNSRAIAIFHAIFIATMSIYFLFWSDLYSDRQLTTLITLRHSVYSAFSLGVSVGYFVWDLGMIIRLYSSLGGLEYVVHHLLAIVSILYAILTGEGQVYIFMVLLSELTAPALNLRWYLDAAGMKNSGLYVINGLMLFLTWLVARVLLFMYFFYHVSAHYDQVAQLHTLGHLLIMVVPSVLAIMNFFWFVKITKGLRKTLKKALLVE